VDRQHAQRSHLHILRPAELQQPRHDGAEQRVAEGSRDEAFRPPLSIICRDAIPWRAGLRWRDFWLTQVKGVSQARMSFRTCRQKVYISDTVAMVETWVIDWTCRGMNGR